MSLNRRKFLENAALSAAALKTLPYLPAFAEQNSVASATKAYGSGYFGNWIEDEF